MYVDDDAGATSGYAGDIEPGQSGTAGLNILLQSGNNYQYDLIGQLVKDVQEQQEYQWRTGDKKLKVQKSTNTTGTQSQLEFMYNPLGQRVLKIRKTIVGGVLQPESAYPYEYTFYAYDANGQVMATYKLTNTSTVKIAELDERMIYGAGRLGTVQSSTVIYTNQSILLPMGPTLTSELGRKNYELTNHLGNVNAVITDRKMVSAGGAPSTYEAVVIMKADYYPFGMTMDDRYDNSAGYRYAYNGMEVDPEMKGDGNSYTTEFRQYDPRLGRWASRDPKAMPGESCYMAMGNNPVFFSDPFGDIVKAHDRKSADEMIKTLEHTFAGHPYIQYLFRLESDGLTLQQISATDLANALKNIHDQDVRDLAYAYYLAINDAATHEVYFIHKGQATLSEINVNDHIVRNGQNLLDYAGGGVNSSSRGAGSTTHISYLQNFNSETKTYGVHAKNIDENGEILAHELLGHGYNGNKGSEHSQHQDAIQMSNLFRRVISKDDSNVKVRDGLDHGSRTLVENPTGLPVNFSGVNEFITLNQTKTNYIIVGHGKWTIEFDSNLVQNDGNKYHKVKDIRSGKDFEVFRDKKDGKWHFKNGPYDTGN